MKTLFYFTALVILCSGGCTQVTSPTPETATPIPPTPEPEIWDYVVMGVMTRNVTSDIPDQFAAYMEQDLGVKVLIHEQPRWVPDEMLEKLNEDAGRQQLIQEAEVITLDFHLEFLNVPEGLFVGGICHGEDNQDCLREALEQEQGNFTAILDRLAELRRGAPVLLRVFIISDHLYGGQFKYHVITPEKEEVVKGYYHDYQKFVEEEGRGRGIAVVRALPDPYFVADSVPMELVEGDGAHFLEKGSRLISDSLRALGYEFAVIQAGNP